MENYIIHYHELALKKGNRRFFENKMVENIYRALKDCGDIKVKKLPGRFFLSNYRGSTSIVEERLAKIPGIANFMLVFSVSGGDDIQALKKEIEKEIEERKDLFNKRKFRVSTKRADKSFPLTSEDINREIGALVVEKTGAKVDLENPEVTVYIEVVSGKIFFSFEKIKGIGGLPVGSSGKIVSLLSGGIDSPVSSSMMMKRGCKVVFAHFHSFPYLDYSSCDKAKELVNLLNDYQYDSKLYFLPLGDAQKEIVLKAPEKYRVILYRRLMIRIAEKVAEKEKAKALVTGESVGQVASQTIENISVVNNIASLPILRPLVGMNKEEIIDISKKIGTYDISILHDQDCCQVFMPKHPATKAVLSDIEKVESGLDIEKMVNDVFEKVEVKEFRN